MKRILCIGDIVLDILPSPFPISKEKILQDGETFVNSVSFQRGGCGGNFVCVLKTIYPQAEVLFRTRIGNDERGDFLIKQMEKYGVKHLFVKDYSVTTQLTIAISFKDGERHFITHLGGLENFCIDDIPDDLIQDIDHLAFRGIWFAEKLLISCDSFLKIAQSRNIPISMDLGFDPYWNRDDRNIPEIQKKIEIRKQSALNALQYLTYLFGNEKEFLNLTDTLDLDHALRVLLKQGVPTIIMHRGSKGAAVIQLKKRGTNYDYDFIEIPAAKVKIRNPVGSGDTFDSVFIAQILEGRDIIQAAVIASASAAYSLQSEPGTRILMDDVLAFIKHQPELQKFL